MQDKILIIEDSVMAIFLMEFLEEFENYKVFTAENGIIGLQIAKEVVPDLILLDIAMPEMNGYEVCQRLKDEPETKDIPVIFLSALSKFIDKVKAFEVGGIDYITKPYHKEELLVRINNHLKLSKLNSTLKEKNRELIAAKEKAEVSKQQLDSFINSATDSFMLFDKNMNYETINKKAIEKFFPIGTKKEDVMGKNILDFVPELEKTKRFRQYQNVIKTGKPLLLENIVSHPAFGNYHLRVQMFKVGDGLGAVITDVTENIKAKQELIRAKESAEKSENKVVQILDAFDDSIYISTNNFEISYMNKELATNIGKDKLGTKCYKSIYGFDEKCKWCKLDDLKSSRKLVAYDIKIPNKKEYRNIRCLILSNNQKITIFQDITERVEAEKKTLQTIITTEENERKRFAQDIHDGIGPLLAAIKHYTQWIAEENNKNERTVIKEKALDLINEAETTVRRTASGLSPYILQNFGLLDAIQAFADRIMETTAIKIKIKTNKPQFTDKMVEITLYRVLTELINNTFKHAKATEIRISIWLKDNKIKATYKDNGIGFDMELLKKSVKGIGLFNIKNRVIALNGTFNIQSSVLNGTQVVVEFNNNV